MKKWANAVGKALIIPSMLIGGFFGYLQATGLLPW